MVVMVENGDDANAFGRVGVLDNGQYIAFPIVHQRVGDINSSDIVHVHAAATPNVGVNDQRHRCNPMCNSELIAKCDKVHGTVEEEEWGCPR